MVRPRGSHPRPVAIFGAGSVPRTRPLQDDKAAHGAMVSSIVVVASSCNDDFAEPSTYHAGTENGQPIALTIIRSPRSERNHTTKHTKSGRRNIYC